MFGCRHDGGGHGREPPPATNSPSSPVERSGTGRPLHKTVKRESVIPDTFTCNRSTDESTLRTVTLPEASSPNTCHGSKARRKSKRPPRLVTEPINGNRNSKCGANHSL